MKTEWPAHCRRGFLNASFGNSFRQYSKVTTFWKALLPQVFKSERSPKLMFTKNTNDSSDSRNLSSDVESLTPTELLARKRIKKPKKEQRIQKPKIEKSTEKVEVDEQKLHTERPPVKKTPTQLKRERKEEFTELPPRQKCRLSCPLPPEEFSPPEKNDFVQNYQPPNVRFSTLPNEFLPQHQDLEGQGALYTMKHTERNVRKNSMDNVESDFLSEQPPKPKKLKKVKKGRSDSKSEKEIIKMKALLFEPNTLNLNYDAVNAPTYIYKDEVLVQVSHSGVSKTDFFITEGKLDCGENPVILGHEISGTVFAIGSDVNHVNPGDSIVINPFTACSVCRYCSRGLFFACVNEGLLNSIGVRKNGGWAEFVVVKKSQVYKIPRGLGLDQAALIQPLSCVLSAMSKLKLTHDMDIFIQGLDLTGCLWASVLHSKGFKNVFVTDKSEKKRKQFESLETNYAIIPSEDIGKNRADVVIECTGSPLYTEKSFNILNSGGQMCFFGIPSPQAQVRCMPYEIIQKEITIVGNVGNSFRFSEAINVATSMGRRYLDYDRLGVGTFNLEDFKGAFHLKKSDELNKIMFKLDS